VQRALAESGGNRRRAAQRLGLSYDQLRGILRKHE
jgi:transcriptional regulator with AAA-type ATPase domain